MCSVHMCVLNGGRGSGQGVSMHTLCTRVYEEGNENGGAGIRR